jgi:tRNA A-37 threonylcarbamoyl transferase component Bud32
MTRTLCPEDDALLFLILGDPVAGDVQTHVDACPGCRQRLDRMKAEIKTLRLVTPGGPGDTLAEDVPAAVPARRRPATIGKYFIVGELGTGGQARVYRAVHPALGRDVVIKWGHHTPDPSDATPDRLVDEAKLLAELEHPNLARVFDLDFHEGRPYLVMEYVRGGRNIEEVTNQDRLTPRAAAELVARVARALAVAHRRGITHQDVNPRNVLIDDEGRPRLIDFGIARLRHVWGAEDGQPVGGTLRFMAPEQARGEVNHIDQRTDVFGLGGLLYFLLTDEAPFPEADARVVHERTVRGETDLSALQTAKVPRGLAAVCRRALAAKPAERYPAAEAMAADLERWLRRPRQLLAMAAGVTGVLVLIGGYELWPAAPPAFPKGPQYLIEEIRRNGRIFNLMNTAPLRAGDRFHIGADLPRGYRASVFVLDSRGRLQAYRNVPVSPGQSYDHLTYPPGDALLTPDDHPGTELVLVCGDPSKAPGAAQVEDLLPNGEPLPPLPPGIVIAVDQDGIHVERTEDSRGFTETEGDALQKLEARLAQLRLQLRQRFRYFTAVVYSHAGS